jgi:hypothetical protein
MNISETDLSSKKILLLNYYMLMQVLGTLKWHTIQQLHRLVAFKFNTETRNIIGSYFIVLQVCWLLLCYCLSWIWGNIWLAPTWRKPGFWNTNWVRLQTAHC